MSPREVLFLSWRDTTHPDGGGAEVYLEEIAAGLARRGHRVTILCARHPGAARDEVRDGVRYVRRGGRLTVYLHGLWWLLTGGRGADLVVDVINGLPFAAPLVRRRGLVALVHHVHRDQWHIIYPGLGGHVGWFVESRIVPLLYRRTPFVAVSEATATELATLGIERRSVTVIRNGTAALPEPSTSRSTNPRLLVLSRLVPHKRIEQAIDLTRDLRADFPDLTLDIAGDGWWADEIDRYIAEQGAGPYVTRHGHVGAHQRSDVVARAWVHVVPSVKEGWCLAVTEAAVLGVPSVAYFSAGGTRESIEHGSTGLLADGYDELRDHVRRLLDPGVAAQFGQRARTRALTFTWQASVDRFEALLDSRPAEGHSP